MSSLPTSLLAAVLALHASGCCEDGSGRLAEETRQVSRFSRVRMDVPGTLRLIQGPASPVRLRTDENLMEEIEMRVRDDDTLVIRSDDDWCLDPTELVLEVSSPEIRAVTVDGSGDVILPKPIEVDELTLAIDGSGSISTALIQADQVSIDIDGSGDVEIDVDAARIATRIDGSGDLFAAGSAAEHRIEIDGSADIEAASLQTARTRIEIDGSGGCAVAADDTLDVRIDGSGEVSYCGDPRVTQSIDGSGEVRRADPRSCD